MDSALHPHSISEWLNYIMFRSFLKYKDVGIGAVTRVVLFKKYNYYKIAILCSVYQAKVEILMDVLRS